MAGKKSRSGGARPGSGGARPGAGRPRKQPELTYPPIEFPGELSAPFIGHKKARWQAGDFKEQLVSTSNFARAASASVTATINDPAVRWVDVDPTLAAEWLKRNSQNRPKKTASIARYVDDMKGGAWKKTGSPVQFGQSGRLVDGQNRLQAIIDSGASVRMLVVEGVDDEIFDVIDGGAKRTGSDMLHIEGYEGWVAACGATASQIAASLMAGQLPYSLHFSAQGVRQFVLEHPDLMQSVEYLSDLPRKGVPLIHSAGAALHFLMAKKDATLADSLMRKLYTGEDLRAGEMILNLRNLLTARAMGNTGARANSTASIGATIRVWNAARRGTNIKHIQNAFVRTGDAWPEIG